MYAYLGCNNGTIFSLTCAYALILVTVPQAGLRLVPRDSLKPAIRRILPNDFNPAWLLCTLEHFVVHTSPGREAPTMASQLRVRDVDDWPTVISEIAAERTLSKRMNEAYAAECAVFATLEAESSSRLRIVRAVENAPVDGAFVLDPEGIAGMPPLGTNHIAMLDWLTQTGTVKLLTFDVKSLKFLHRRRENTKNTSYRWAKVDKKNDLLTNVVIATIEGIERAFAIVPSIVWTKIKFDADGVEPLLQKIPSTLQIYMVQLEHLETAIESLLRAAVTCGSKPYQNPSTGVIMDGWQPQLATVTDLKGARPIQTSSEAIVGFRDLVVRSGAGNDFFANPIQPMLFDGLLRLEGLDQLLYIEHKIWQLRMDPQATVPVLNPQGLSPFAPGRIWHFLIAQKATRCPKSAPSFICVPRDAIPDHWYTMKNIPQHEFFTFNDIVDALRFIRSRAEGAIRVAAQALSSSSLAVPEEEDGEEEDEDQDEDQDEEEEQGEEDEVGEGDGETEGRGGEGEVSKTRSHHRMRTLPWLSSSLNELCATNGYGIVFALPYGHTMCSHVLVDYVWEEGDNLEDGLPRVISDHRLMNARVLPLQFVNNRVALMPKDPAYPIWLSQGDWRRRAVHQHFLYVGSCMSRAYMDAAHSLKEYWLFSSEFTTHLSLGLRSQVNSRDKILQFNGRSPKDHQLDRLPLSTASSKAVPLLQGSSMLAPDHRGINPARYIVSGENSLYITLCSILKGNGSVNIGGQQSFTQNTPVTAEKHHVALREVLQATWDFGSELFSAPLMVMQWY